MTFRSSPHAAPRRVGLAVLSAAAFALLAAGCLDTEAEASAPDPAPQCTGAACDDPPESQEPACVVDTDCEAGHTCDEGECLHIDPPEGCLSDSDCPAGDTCVDGDCAPETETPAEDDEPAPNQDQCASDHDCPAGTVCDTGPCAPCVPGDDGEYACPPCFKVCYGPGVEQPSEGEPTEHGEEPEQPEQPAPNQDQCASDDDCPAGTVCDTGPCEPCVPGDDGEYVCPPCFKVCYGPGA